MQLFSNIKPYLSLLLLMVSIYFCSILVISQLAVVKPLILVIMALTPSILIPFIFLWIVLPFIGKYYCIKFFQNNNEYPPKIDTLIDEYALVLISNAQSHSMINSSLKRCYKNYLVYSSIASLYFLFKHFRNHDIKYKLKQRINKEDLDDAISDIKCKELYLIGHGSRGCFKTSEEPVYYSKYDDGTKSKKQIISQLHCNSIEYKGTDTEEYKKKNTALTTLLAINKENSFLTERNNTVIDVLCYCWRLSNK